MAIRPEGKTFKVDVSYKGRRRKATSDTMEEAKKLEKQLLHDLQYGSSSDLKLKRCWTMGEALEHCSNHVWKGTKAEYSTIHNCKSAMKFYGKNKPLDEITVESLDQFVATLLSAKYSDSSINRKLACISKFQNEALKRDRLQKKTYIPRRKERKGRIRFITGEEEQSIIQLLTQYDHQDFLDFLLVLVDTGMRRGEVLTSLVAKDIDFQQNIITIWENKADHPRSVPMTKRVRAILQRRLKVHPFILFPHKGNWGTPIWNHVKSAMGLAHDEQFVPHCLRHTCASRLVQRGINLKVVQEWLGHKNIMMTMRYAHLAPKNLHDAVHVLEPITPLRVVKNGTDGTGSVPESEEIT